ncbi:MAG: type I DNA topoisomerase [Deltaproteobacteria bacterium]|jgi:DNA topoisomerase-1|nr:type I DNA topoisomerase [Deltaproteobacteria bacterium]
MSEKTLVIVESPTKARTIAKFLGKDFVIKASNGHIRDLPSKADEIPANIKKEKWSRLGVNVEKDFEPIYVIPASKKAQVKALQDAIKSADMLYLATDEDREGESISWHLLEILKPEKYKIPYQRLVFHEITKEAIKKSLEKPRQIDFDLVSAQETRRILDRLYGYEVSPLLWQKIAPKLSAGRVQSVAMKMLVEREKERIGFISSNYWTLKVNLNSSAKEVDSDFVAELFSVVDKRVALGKDFDPSTGKLIHPDKVIAFDKLGITELLERLKAKPAIVSAVEEKSYTSKPLAPFITSSLQQEANTKLHYSAKRTMTVAQRLYENGLITYMRTDSTTLSEQAINAARTLIQHEYGAEYLPATPRVYATRVKNAQEAHEAIRPAGEVFVPISEVTNRLGDEAGRLYELIWKRTVASQMQDAKGTQIAVTIDIEDAKFKATGKTIEFPGYLRAYVEGSEDPEADLQDQERILPKLSEKQELVVKGFNVLDKNTQPPARYSEGSLIKELEKKGIGRPSTWATVLDTVLSRGYAFKKGNAVLPTWTAFAVLNLLEQHFHDLVNYEFTANLEDDLDNISRGEAKSLKYLQDFYFGGKHTGLKTLLESGKNGINPREVCGIKIGETTAGQVVEVRIGKFGAYLTNGEKNASLPSEMAPDELTLEKAEEILNTAKPVPESLGVDPESNLPVYLKTGPYGYYVQLGENRDKKNKPKMASLMPNMSPENLTLEEALKLFALPRVLGKHPQTGEEVIATRGRFGPYVQCGKENRSFKYEMYSPLDIKLEQALELLAQEKNTRRAVKEPETLRVIGKVPALQVVATATKSKKKSSPLTSELIIELKNGRYGPYVTDGEINATVQKDLDLEKITLEQALNLLDEKRARGTVKKRKRGGGE